MLQAALLDAWPWALALLVTCGAIATLVRVARSTFDYRPSTFDLHRDERGSVQSLSFVLTMPLFIMLMMLAVQLTQVMIGQMLVHYAAFAAGRAASVWIPARVDWEGYSENRIGERVPEGNEGGGELYRVVNEGPKYEKIREAAALACLPLGPSRDLGTAQSDDQTMLVLRTMFDAVSSSASTNPRVYRRLSNKWAYAKENTDVIVHVFHRRFGPGYRDEPPLWDLNPMNPDGEYKLNEVGWRDQIRVTVNHDFALLPGPGRMLARKPPPSAQADRVTSRIGQSTPGVYTIRLSATVTMVTDGEKSLRPYVHRNL
jgi:hypothetical protein